MKAAIFFIAVTLAAQNQTGTVTGVVVDSISHAPVKKASVQLYPINGIPAGAPQGPWNASTDATGSFALNNVAAGRARIMVKPPNHSDWRLAKVLDLGPGETVGPVTVELVPDAIITGHVVDEDGDPLNGCNVQLHPAGHPEQAAMMLGGVPASNLDGEYRVSGVKPGKYIASVNCFAPVFQPRPFSAGPDPPPSRAYPSEYYPSTTDANSAQVIELAPGMEKAGVDFQMKPVAVTQVRGSFSGDAWRGLRNANLQLVNLERGNANGAIFGSSVNWDKGTFEFLKVFPGSYLLAGFTFGANAIGGERRIEVKDQPLETVFEWRRATDISGTVEVENHGDQTTSPSQVQISLMPAEQIGMPSTPTVAQADGTFTLKSVLPGRWRIRANGPGIFVKSAWAGTDDITNEILDTSGGAAGPLRVVVSNNTATVHGTAPLGETIAAAGEEGSNAGGIVLGTPVNENGQFTIGGLAPGKYRIIAMDQFGGMVPAEGGTEVTVGEGETVTVDLKN